MKRSIHQVGSSSGRGSITQYGRMVQRRPFKKVRVQGNQLVPYGRSSTYVQRPYQVGARGITKGVDTQLSSAANMTSDMSTTTDILPLNLIQAGTGSWNRVGRVVSMKSIRLRLHVTLKLAPTDTLTFGRSFRYLIIYDTQPNGVLPTKGDILGHKTQTGSEASIWNSLLAYDNMQRFTILKDETIVLNPHVRTFDSTGAPKGDFEMDANIDCFLKLNHLTNFKAESSPSTIADISTGGLYVMFLTDSQDVNRGAVSVNGSSIARLRYTDQ